MSCCLTYITFGFFCSVVLQETLTLELFGAITPHTRRVILNGTLELNCTVQNGINTSTLYWETPEGKAPGDITFIIGSYTIQLRKKVTSISEEGTYLCRSTSEKQISRSPRANVFVEYEAVRNVTNFTCMVIQEKDELQCKWELGTYIHEEYLSILPSVSFDDGYHFLDCPEESPHESCTWSQNDGDIYSILIWIKLTITNTEFKLSKTFFYFFRSKEILRLGPPTDIESQVMSSCTCVKLNWSSGERFMATSTKIVLNSKWNVTPRVQVIDYGETAMICGLIPNSVYEFEIQQKPSVGFYYSDSTTAKFKTCITAPTIGPGLFSSGYSARECGTSSELRTVIIYWKKIPEMYQNGAIHNYTVISDGLEHYSFGASTFYGSLLVPCEGCHNLSVTACNSVGCSPQSSIIIMDHKELQPPDKLIVEREDDDDKLHLFWFGSSQDASQVQIIWCKGEVVIQKCRGEINVLQKDISLTGNHEVVSTQDINDSVDDSFFGVAFLSGANLSSGIRWQETCRYTKGSEIKKPSNINLLPDPSDKNLIVSWSPIKCDRTSAKNAYVHSYRIQYCQLDGLNNCKEDKASASIPADGMTRYTIVGLIPEKKYGIWVAAVSLGKNISTSDMIIGTPISNDLTNSDISLIVAGSVLGFILAIFGFVCITRQVIRKIGFREKFPIQTIPIEGSEQTVSDLPLEYKQYTKELNRDSGHSSNSSAQSDSHLNHDYLLIEDQKPHFYAHKSTINYSERILRSDTNEELRSSSSESLTYIPPLKEIMDPGRSCGEDKALVYKYNKDSIQNQLGESKCPKDVDYLSKSTLQGKSELSSKGDHSEECKGTEVESLMDSGYLQNTAIPGQNLSAETISDYISGKLFTKNSRECLLNKYSRKITPVLKTYKKNMEFNTNNQTDSSNDDSDLNSSSASDNIIVSSINPVPQSISLCSSSSNQNDQMGNFELIQTKNMVDCNDSYIPFEASLQQSHLCY
ncbi:uncharacterized protein LOC134243488 isoform X2 [Saccostrea cucullata]|uniref:uncharacterized protein LOC134243488 isoform X2 n=1 Tax=Saccostrea cuccullata TaxID=36930 RepID=UPI002ED071DF